MAESETSKTIKKCILCLWEKYFIICELEMHGNSQHQEWINIKL